jgi:hypothetical protein
MAEDSGQEGQLPPLLAASKKSAAQHNIPVEYLDTQKLYERFPQFQMHSNFVGLLEPGAGLLRPERIMSAALQEAASHSETVSMLENAHIAGFHQTEDGIVELRLVTNKEESVITTNKLLISAGAWTADLLPTWSPQLKIVRQVQGWIDVKRGSAAPNFGYKRMPAFVLESPSLPDSLYGLPCDSDDPDYAAWLKIGIHKLGANENCVILKDPITNPGKTSDSEAKEIQEAISYAIDKRAWNNSAVSRPGNELPTLAATQPCMYTMSPDHHFIIGEPAGCRNVFAVAGLSGHGFKMAPSLGQMMADYALGKDMQLWNLQFCAPSRFGI